MTDSFIPTSTQWKHFLHQANGHILQSWPWGELKSQFGWTPLRLQVDGTGVQILFRRLPLGWTIAYVPKGPLIDWRNTRQCQTLLALIHAEAKKRRTIFLKIEPDVQLEPAAAEQQAAALHNFLTQAGFQPAQTIQPQTSILVDLQPAEDEILAAMKQKTRYNIRLAKRKGVTIRTGSEADIPAFYQLAQTTANRDEFGIHKLAYYQTSYQLFGPDQCRLLLAEFKSKLLAAVMLFRFNETAYYFYGASSNQHRNLMSTYLDQWAAMQWAKQQGCARYDLWGVPNASPATLEAEFTQRHDGLWGVYRFKRGFGGQVVRSVGAYDYVYNPTLYKLYQKLRAGL